VAWDYTPAHHTVNACTGGAYTRAQAARVSPPLAPTAPGSGTSAAYLKTVYVAYTDGTFTRRAAPPDGAAARGAIIPPGLGGPLLTAAVGDTLAVTFHNRGGAADGGAHPLSVHPHGLRYAKGAEGAAYADGTAGADAADNAVPVGGTVTVRWGVPPRSGPGPAAGAAAPQVWVYHSHVAEVADTAAGLFGVLLVYPRGGLPAAAAAAAAAPPPPIPFFVGVLDETLSLHAGVNLPPAPPGGWAGSAAGGAHRKFTLGGTLFCAPPPGGGGVRLAPRAPLRLAAYTLGTEVDVHTLLADGSAAGVGRVGGGAPPAGGSSTDPLLAGRFHTVRPPPGGGHASTPRGA